MPAEITIDPEFHAWIPPLSDDERRTLEANIQAEGCRDALVLWDGILVDGHNRYEICERLGIGYRTVSKTFASRDDALAWIARNQLGRRNLTDMQRIELALKLRTSIEAKARANQKTSTGGADPQLSQNFAKAGTVHTRDEIAKAAGVSRETVRKAETVLAEAPEPVVEAVRKGETSIHKAYTQTRPKPEPATNGHAHANGRSKVNGVETDDPADVAALRKAGRIPEGVVVEVIEPEREPGEDDDLGDEPAEPVELSDEEWLAGLPLDAILTGATRRCFQRDALVYRRLEAARKTYQHHFRRVTKDLARRNAGVLVGQYEGRTSYWLRSDHPRDWKRCADPDQGGCGGAGTVGVVGACPACKGRGYRVFV